MRRAFELVLFLAIFAALKVALDRDDARPGRTVVLVVVDTLRADVVEARLDERGDDAFPLVTSPPIRVHARAFSASGWTLPAVASILTGVDPEVHHAHGKATVLAPLTPDLATLPEAFRDAGWRTAAVTNAAFLSPLLGLDRGFDVYDHEHAYNRTLRRADETVARALEIVEAAGGDDLFLFVHLFDPHLDYDPTADRLAELGDAALTSAAPVTLADLRALEGTAQAADARVRDARRLYELEADAALDAFDRLVEGVLLQERRKPTFVLTADHGEEFLDHGGFEHGHTLHAELVRVPLLMWRFGRGTQPPDRRDGVVSTRDLGRRLLELEGLAVPDSFAPSTSDWDGAGGGVAYSATTLYGPDRVALRTDDAALLVELREGAPPVGAQYDLAADPTEQRPRDPAPALLRRLLDRRRANREAGRATRRLDWLDLGPSKHAERDATLRSLESLGYTGGVGDSDDVGDGEADSDAGERR